MRCAGQMQNDKPPTQVPTARSRQHAADLVRSCREPNATQQNNETVMENRERSFRAGLNRANVE
jgi:hypothetical protein